VTRITTNKKGVFSLRPPLKHRKFARFAQEFHRNQFYFTGKMHIMKKKNSNPKEALCKRKNLNNLKE
jgi:hypothetical protein